MECTHSLSANIVEIDVIGRILLIGIIASIPILTGYWLIDRVSEKQEKENSDYIKDLQETIRAIRGTDNGYT